MHVAGFRPGIKDHEFMNKREALAIAIDNKSVECPFAKKAPWLLSEEFLESGLACYGGRCREHEEICSKMCKQHDLRVPSFSAINTANMGERAPGNLQAALRRLVQSKTQIPSLSTSPSISTQSARSPLLLQAASGSSFSHQPVEKFSSQPGATALVREAAADQVPLGAAFARSLSQPPSATSHGLPIDVGNGLLQSASTPSTSKKPVVAMADRKAAVLGKHQRQKDAFASFFQQPGASSTLKKPSVAKAAVLGKHQGHDFL